jgi:superfamily II DNA or RNA helicase
LRKPINQNQQDQSGNLKKSKGGYLANEQVLRKWQTDALGEWEKHNFKGTVSAPTGTGKTLLGISAIKVVNQKKDFRRALITVPTVHLQEQWKNELIAYGCPTESIGFCGNGFYQPRKYTIAIFNTARDKPIPATLLIIDEAHHASSPENQKILKNNYPAVLAISATPEREDRNNVLFSYAPVIYRYDGYDALAEGHLSEFELINVGAVLNQEELLKLQEANQIIKELFPAFKDFNAVKQALKRFNPDAVRIMKAVALRKQVLQNAENKPVKAVEIITEELKNSSKIILFCEFIDTAEKIRALLENKSIISGIYHSKVKKAERQKLLNEFRTGEKKVMLAVKALDEGVNVPDANVGIVIAGSSVKRQTIQRLGRILRPKDGAARFYQLYIPGTKDEDWMNKRSRTINEIASNIIYR